MGAEQPGRMKMRDDRAPVIGLRARLIAIAIAVIVSLGLCELMARAMYPAPQDPTREPRILFQRRPGGFFLHVPGQRGWMDDGFVTVNALGLRGPEVETPKPSGTRRVLAIGDSTTFGLGVNDDGTYVAQLNARLGALGFEERWEAINGGVSGYNMTLASAFLKHMAPVIEPDVVLVGVFWNDLPYESISPDGEVPVLAPAIGETPSDSDGASEPASAAVVNVDQVSDTPFRIGNQLSTANRFLRKSRLLYVLRQTWLSAIAPTDAANHEVRWEVALLEGNRSPAIDFAWHDLEGRLAGIRDLGRAGGYEVGVVAMPIRAQVEGSYPDAAYQARIAVIAGSLGLFVVDPLPRFLAHPEPSALFIPYDRMHYTALGNGEVAEAVFDAVGRRIAAREPAQH